MGKLDKISNKKASIINLRKILEDLTRKQHATEGNLAAETYYRQQTEVLLEVEKNYLRVLMEYIPDSIYFKDINGKYLKISKKYAEFLGLENPQDGIGKTDFNFYNEDFAKETRNDEINILRTGKSLIGKIEKQIINGKERWVSTTKIPLYDKSKNIVGIAGIGRDITILKNAEKSLEKEHSLIKALINNIPDAIYFKDLNSRYIEVNKATLKKINKPLEEIIGHTDKDLYSEEFARITFEDEQEIIRTDKAIIGKEEKEIWLDRLPTWSSTTKMSLKDSNGKIIGTFGVSRDITDKKKYYDSLHETKRELAHRIAEKTNALSNTSMQLTTRLAQLDFLTTASYELAQFIDLNELYPAIVNTFLNRFAKAEASLSIKNDNHFKCVYATKKLNNKIGYSCSEKALQPFAIPGLFRTYTVDNWEKDEHVGQFPWENLSELSYYLAIPLIADNKMLGCLQIFTEESYKNIYKEEKQLLTTLSAHAAVCQSNASRQQELRKNARMNAELNAARDIQKSFTPKFDVDIPNIKVNGAYHPAFQVGGDYLDCFKTTDGRWILVVADVCGKGVPAALLMTHIRSTFRFEAHNNITAKDLVCAVNKSMRTNLDKMSFVTALCIIIDKDGKTMTYSRAGHPPIIKLTKDNEKPELIQANGLAIGLTSDDEQFSSILDNITINLESGDRFFIYTDGLNEALNMDGESYGLSRLLNLLGNENSTEPKDIITTVMKDVKDFIQDAPYHDDLTLLAITVP